MALKKGFCPHCQGDEKERIFDLNKDAEICYCPHCTSPMQPKDAINNFHDLISSYLKEASRYLFETTEYLRAYQTFAHIIELDETIKVAYFGRLLALVHLSSLRKSKIPFAFLMHKQQAPKFFHYQDTANEYYHFLILLLDALDIYENKMKKRLSSRGVFYDVDCVVLFLKRIEEIKEYKQFLLTEAQFFVDSNKDQFVKIINRINDGFTRTDEIMKETYITADGNCYMFSEYGPNINPILTMKPEKNDAKTRHIKKPISLYAKENKKSPIRDEVYLNNLPLSTFVSASIPLAIALFAIALGAIIAGLILPKSPVKTLLIIASIVLISFSAMLFILHFTWKNVLKKKYYNGTNPFIFK